VVRGSFEVIASATAASRNEKVASTTTTGRVPPASNPILAWTDVGASGLPSAATMSGAIANAVSVSRSASITCVFG
jgi:hypothetical protein